MAFPDEPVADSTPRLLGGASQLSVHGPITSPVQSVTR
jgi:hypothetical protein